jgi:hypothetical protein
LRVTQPIGLPQFITLLMRELNMADAPTPVQLQICDYLENGPKRRVVGAFRGCGKSSLSAMYLLWKLYHNPDEKCLIVSASMSRAEAMTAWMLQTITRVPWLNHMEPDSHDGRYSRINFDVGTCRNIEQSPSVRSAGISSQITGSRASIILADDVETVQTCLTQVQREKLRNNLNELEAVLKPGDKSEIVYLGTPHSSTDSIYFALQRDLHYDMRLWPARVPADTTPYKGALAPLIERRVGAANGRPTDTRFSDEELRQRELSMSPMQWRLQFLLDATLSDIERYPLRCGDLMVMTIDGHLPEVLTYERAKYLALDDLPCVGMAHDPRFYRPAQVEGTVPVTDVPTVMALDPAGGGSDEFAWAIVKAWAGNYFLVESGGRLGGVSENLWERLASLAKRHHVNEILVETNFGGLEVYSQLLKPYLVKAGAACRIEPIRSNQRKELRIIDTLAPVLQTHRMVVDRRVVEADAELLKAAAEERDSSYSLFYQLTRLTHDRGSLLHDDRIDAWAMCIQWFQEQAAQDQRQRQSARHTELLEAHFADWTGHLLMTPDRAAMGMTLDQARQADAATTGASWI